MISLVLASVQLLVSKHKSLVGTNSVLFAGRETLAAEHLESSLILSRAPLLRQQAQVIEPQLSIVAIAITSKLHQVVLNQQ